MKKEIRMARLCFAAGIVLLVARGCATPDESLPDGTGDGGDPDTIVEIPESPGEGDGDDEGTDDGADGTDDADGGPEPDAPADADADPPADPDAVPDIPPDEAPDADAPGDPLIGEVSPPVVAHGAFVTVTGSSLAGTDVAVTIGGTAQTVVSGTDTQIRVGPVGEALPVSAAPGDRSVIVTVDGTASNSLPVTVIRLVINELDSDTPSTPVNDDKEFVEISAGLAGISLHGYVLVRYNGSDDASYGVTELGDAAGTILTTASGLLLIGNASLTPAPAITLGTNTLQNGPDAAAIHQGAAGDFPSGTPASPADLIDALVYDTSDEDDAGLLAALLGTGPESVQVNENQNGAGDAESIFRCCDERLDGRAFSLDCATTAASPAVGTPTPGAPASGCP